MFLFGDFRQRANLDLVAPGRDRDGRGLLRRKPLPRRLDMNTEENLGRRMTRVGRQKREYEQSDQQTKALRMGGRMACIFAREARSR